MSHRSGNYPQILACKSQTMNINLIMMLVIALLALTSLSNSIDANTQLKYKNCSADRNCADCLNQYICNKCKPFARCCPKYCESCYNETTCTKCQQGFQIVSNPYKMWKYCANFKDYTEIDYHRIKLPNYRYTNPPPVSTKCSEGYFYQMDIKFCEKCLVENCQLCHDSIHCTLCEQGYTLKDGLCGKEVDIYKVENKGTQISITLAYEIGIFIGCCLTCVLIKVFYCTKKRCQSFFRSIFRKKNQNLIINDEITLQLDVEMQKKEDRMGRLSQKTQASEDFQRDSLSNKEVITEQK